MSEPQLISPLLDGFIMGDPISEHDGVRCCPAMQTETEHKYIVKVISIPAKQEKLDALLLAGAFSDKSSALAYFKDLADGIESEAALLQRLSRLEGFVPYESWQTVPMEEDSGYDIYLLGAYRPTLEYKLQRNELTHLGAVNLGLDLCAALSVCRRLGYLYVDLKPSNIYISNDREYRIGDIGFVNLSSLKFASLPDKYHSSYTAPEITDAYSTLNDTMDVYAAGMILYQAFNGGKLPYEGMAPQQEFPAPQYADAEMAEIIRKACAPSPEDRWKDPMQMGQALIDYLQRNNVNDVPIIPVPAEPEEPEQQDNDQEQEPTASEVIAEVDEALGKEDPGLPASDNAEAAPSEGSPAEEASDSENAPEEETDTDSEEPADEAEEDTAVPESTEADVPADAVSEESSDSAPEAAEAQGSEEISDEAACDGNESEEAEGSNTAGQEEVSDEASDNSDTASDDTSESPEKESDVPAEDDILAHADDLIAHQLPDPVVAPEPIDVPVPAPDDTEPEKAETDEDSPAQEAAAENAPEAKEAGENSGDLEDAPAEEAETITDVPETAEQPDSVAAEKAVPRKKGKKPRKGLIITLTVILVLLLVGFGSYLFYEHYYLQTVYDITLQGSEDHLSVILNTEIDDSLLTVICTDSYGNTLKQTVSGGTAEFKQLRPGTAYKIRIEIDGFHKLIGKTLETYSTAEQTFVSEFRAITGNEDGSVILSFTVQGPESPEWKVYYTAEGEEEGSVICSGHTANITGLTVGKEYAFRAEPATELYLAGENTLKFVPSKIIYAEDLKLLGFTDNALAAVWKVPEGVTVSSWSVRCYNDAGYDKTITVTEPKAVFEDLDHASAYNVEVTAEGMTLGSRAYLSANSITFHKIDFDSSNKNQLKVSWEYEGVDPEGGWLLLYTVDGKEQQVVKCDSASGVISPMIPGGHYEITIQPANGATSFGGTQSYEAPAAVPFQGYQVSAKDIDFKMCITPKKANWNRYNVPKSDYRTTFEVGVSASFVLHLTREYKTSSDNIVTLYVVRDAEGKIVSNATESRTWTSMWYKGYGKLTIPFMPENPGKYTVEIYFNGTAVTTQAFEVVAAK